MLANSLVALAATNANERELGEKSLMRCIEIFKLDVDIPHLILGRASASTVIAEVFDKFSDQNINLSELLLLELIQAMLKLPAPQTIRILAASRPFFINIGHCASSKGPSSRGVIRQIFRYMVKLTAKDENVK